MFEPIVPGSVGILDRVIVALARQLVRLLPEGPEPAAIADKELLVLSEKPLEIGSCHVVL
jgi:hypothetical protein